MRKLVVKLAVAVIALCLMRQHVPPKSAYSLRPLSNMEKNLSRRLPAGNSEQRFITPTELRRVWIFRLSDGNAIANAHEYISDAGLRPGPMGINEMLAMIESAARAEVARCVENGLLPAQDAWQRKAVATIVMSSLPTMEELLKQTFPDS